jgi:hypothetical protein
VGWLANGNIDSKATFPVSPLRENCARGGHSQELAERQPNRPWTLL